MKWADVLYPIPSIQVSAVWKVLLPLASLLIVSAQKPNSSVWKLPFTLNWGCWLAEWMSFVTRLYLVSKEIGFQSLMFVLQHWHQEYDSKFIKLLWSVYWMQKPLNKVLKSFLERIQNLNCKVVQTSSIVIHFLVSDSIVTHIFLES